jgi:hypothetical protein
MPIVGRDTSGSNGFLDYLISMSSSGAEVYDPYAGAGAGAWVRASSPRGAELLRLKALRNVRELAARRWARNASTKPGTKRAAASNGGGASDRRFAARK